MRRKITIGLTGGIATGKSTVLNEFKKLGAQTLDCDVLAREAVQKGRPALRHIARKFGKEILNLDGTLNREALGRIVFAQPAKRKALEIIIHPEVKKQVIKFIKRVKKGIVIIDVPLLFEKGWKSLFDQTLVVWAPQKVQLARLLGRNKLSKSEALSRIRSQMSAARKRKLADDSIDNSCDFGHTRSQARTLWKGWSRR